MLFWPKVVLWPQLTLVPPWRWGRSVAQLVVKIGQRPHERRAASASVQNCERMLKS